MPSRKRGYGTAFGKIAKRQKSSGYRARRRFAKKVRSRGTTIGRQVGFPRMLKFKHTYQETVQLTTTAVLGSYHFSANGMYDPNISGTGHQPYYFDQMTPLYNHYHVIGSRIKVKIIPASSNQAACQFVLWLNDDTSVPTSMTTINENKFAVQTVRGPSDERPTFLTHKFSTKKWFGNVMANDELKGTNSTNPTEQVYYTINFQPLDQTATSTFYASVDIEYIAIWNELREVSGS